MSADLAQKIRLLAIYLPQFHPIPENDEWWGKGFTEWTNVTKAKPKFKGHYQPHLPADLGFYDLRLPEVMEAQAALAKAYGIHGFCFYHYWFNGKKLLERPVEQMLRSKQPDFPFCLCWANENWTRRWDGRDKQVLIKQDYNFEDDKAHIHYLFQFFEDDRYIKVNGKPIFIIYRPELLPDIKKTIDIWRAEAVKRGIGDIYIIGIERFTEFDNLETYGFDALMEFQPDRKGYPKFKQSNLVIRALHRLKLINSYTSSNHLVDYEKVVDAMLQKEVSSKKIYPSVTPMWDNTARRKKWALVLQNSSPEIGRAHV